MSSQKIIEFEGGVAFKVASYPGITFLTLSRVGQSFRLNVGQNTRELNDRSKYATVLNIMDGRFHFLPVVTEGEKVKLSIL